MQQADCSDQSERKLRERNAVLQRFKPNKDETLETMTQSIGKFVANRFFQTDATVCNVKR